MPAFTAPRAAVAALLLGAASYASAVAIPVANASACNVSNTDLAILNFALNLVRGFVRESFQIVRLPAPSAPRASAEGAATLACESATRRARC